MWWERGSRKGETRGNEGRREREGRGGRAGKKGMLTDEEWREFERWKRGGRR